MAKQPTEDEQDVKRKARRRLVGALALTLIVVVVLPMILDSEPKPAGQDIDLRIPAPDQAGAFVHKTVVPPPELPASSVAPAPVEASAVKPVETKEPVAKIAAAKPAEQKTESTPAAKENPAAAQSYVAQVGAYSDVEHARQILADLKKWSFKAYSEKSGNKVRVRVGPYSERDKAEKVCALLEKHGLHPVVMTTP